MIKSFHNQGTEDVFDVVDSKAARKVCPLSIWKVTLRKLDIINQATDISDLKVPPSNRLEKLKGDREGQYSIRINDQYRICFRWDGQDANDVEIVDYH